MNRYGAVITNNDSSTSTTKVSQVAYSNSIVESQSELQSPVSLTSSPTLGLALPPASNDVDIKGNSHNILHPNYALLHTMLSLN